MKIGLVGYQGSGKSTLFHWLTGVAPDPAAAHVGQSAMAAIPDPRIEKLCEVYHPKKVTIASLELVDTPGMSRAHEGNAARLAMIREAGCLVLVAAAFDGGDTMADIRSFDEDLMLADMEIVTGRIERLEESLKKPLPRPEHLQLEHERETLGIVLRAIESGNPLRESHMSEEQRKVTRAFRLLSEKPRLVIVNTADDESDPERFTSRSTPELPILAVPAGLELELSKMSAEDRAEFEREMDLVATDRDHLIRTLMDVSGQMIFFTAGEKEVRTWLLRRGGTALEAADNIHTDLARGFIRAEVMAVADLLRVGGEREIKAQHLMRQEPKDYVIQDDDIIFIRFSV
ncbi:MAG: redox-regulated ATPase YchF [Pirellulales bacterium]|nr:redox-regulated ATPase YchF [Pirellulales bacterium]